MADPECELRLQSAASGNAYEEGFDGADLNGARFVSGRLAGASFKGASLRKADGSGAYLQNAQLSQADLTSARLVSADLRGATLVAATLKNADLNSATLRGADLQFANLRSCKLTRADLTRAALAGADLTKADFRGAKGLNGGQLHQAKNWDKAVYDENMSRTLGLEQDQETGRRGIVSPRRKSGCYSIDLFGFNAPLHFGDVFLLTGDNHPSYPPTGHFDLAALANLGFQQCDDYFATAEEKIWLYCLEKNRPRKGGQASTIVYGWS